MYNKKKEVGKMMITTSYFASKAPVERKVCIAKKWPRFFRKGNLWIKEFAPSDPWAKDWRRLYRADLQFRFPDQESLRAKLEEINAIVHDPILCCYEKDVAECHRGELAKYITQTLGISIHEWREGL
jgi:uncharacterized protein YeaO (DUF488 family)